MAFNFPNAPTVNQVYTPTSGVSYVWTGTQWDRLATAAITIPPGVYMPYGGATEPLGWLFCDGRAISRSAYPLLFVAIGIAHGAGDGTTTFNLPDMRGRAAFGRDDMGGVAAGRLTNAGVGNSGINGALLGAAGGLDRYALALTQMAAHQHPINGNTGTESADHTHWVAGRSGNDTVNHTHYISGWTDVAGDHMHTTNSFYSGGASGSTNFSAASPVQNKSARGTDNAGSHQHSINFASGTVSAWHQHDIAFSSGGISATHTHALSFMSGDNAGGGEAHPIVPPALVANYIIFTGA